jgi:hypothetical protein
MSLFAHDTAAQKLGIELEYEPLVELAQQHNRDGSPAVGALIELLTSFTRMFTSPHHIGGDDGHALFWQLRDVKPSVMTTLLALVDTAHCQLAEVLQAWSQDSPYQDTLADAFRTHLDASDRTTEAIQKLTPGRDGY